MRTIITIVISFSVMLMSCGPNAEQKAATQKLHDDSIAAATAEQIQMRQAEERAIQDSIVAAVEKQKSLRNSIQELSNQKSQLEQQLMQAKADLAGENSRMESIKGVQFMRFHDEKAEQVKKQQLVIENIKSRINNIEININDVEQKINQVKSELNNTH